MHFELGEMIGCLDTMASKGSKMGLEIEVFLLVTQRPGLAIMANLKDYRLESKN